jgi:hypothetical protein
MSKKKKVIISPKPNVAYIKKHHKSDIAEGKKVKVATSNLFVFNTPPERSDVIADAIIEDIGGQEIINLTRTNLVNGQNVTYNVIANLASTQAQFNPNTMIALQGTDASYFGSFPLLVSDFTPEYGTATDIDGNYTGDTVYVDPDTGQVVINTINLRSGLNIEVEFVTYGNAIDGTIYL